MGHGSPSLRAPDGALEKGDQTRVAEILETFPILAPKCAESILRLARFDREQWLWDEAARLYRPEGTIERDGLDFHARRLLGHVQRELAARQSPLSYDEAFELHLSRKVALQALMRVGRPDGNRYAKIVQAEVAAPGVPLAICVGSGHETRVRDIPFRASGCLAVFEDASYGRGRRWPTWCPKCTPKNGKRNPARDQARAFSRRVSTASARSP